MCFVISNESMNSRVCIFRVNDCGGRLRVEFDSIKKIGVRVSYIFLLNKQSL